MAPTRTLSVPAPRPLQGGQPPTRSRGGRADRLVELAVTAAAFVGIGAVALILIFIAREALPLFLDPSQREAASLSKLLLPQPWRTGQPDGFLWQPVARVPHVSLLPLFMGTLKVSSVAMVLAVPLGVAAALFSTEFAPRWLRELLKPVVELLAGVPSVVLGFFALTTLATVMQDSLDLPYRLNALVAGVAMAMAIVPIVYTVSEDAFRSVPNTWREASLALGGTRWDTAAKVVLPAAAPGVLGACVLAFGRAVGETMIVLMVSGNAALVSGSLVDPTRTVAATIAAEMGEVVVGDMHYSLLFFLGALLFLFNLALNATAGKWVRARMRRREGRSVS
ncbi:MAG: phosphate ABC transporter permease subunit PstC [Myxococcota bacterium]